jgi:hypothetical protein
VTCQQYNEDGNDIDNRYSGQFRLEKISLRCLKLPQKLDRNKIIKNRHTFNHLNRATGDIFMLKVGTIRRGKSKQDAPIIIIIQETKRVQV